MYGVMGEQQIVAYDNTNNNSTCEASNKSKQHTHVRIGDSSI